MANFRWQVGGCGCDCEPTFSCSKTFTNAPCILGEDLTKEQVKTLFNVWSSKYKNFSASFGVLTSVQSDSVVDYLKISVPQETVEGATVETYTPVSGSDLYPSPEFSFFQATSTEVELEEKLSEAIALDEDGFIVTACKPCESLDSLYVMRLPVGNLSRSLVIDSSSYTNISSSGTSLSTTVSARSTVTFSGSDSCVASIPLIQPTQGEFFRRGSLFYALSPETAYYRFFNPSASLVAAFESANSFDGAGTFSDNSLIGVSHAYSSNYGGVYPFTSSAPILYRSTSVGSLTYYYRCGPALFTASPTGSLLVGGSASVTGISVTTPPGNPTIQGSVMRFQDVVFDVLVSGPFTFNVSYGQARITEEEFLANATSDNTVSSFTPYNYLETIKAELQSILDNDMNALIDTFYKPVTGCVIGIPAERLVFGNWATSPVSSGQSPSLPPRFQDCQENE